MGKRLPDPARPEAIVMSIGLRSGDFSSTLEIPVPKTDAEIKKAMERWMDFMLTGLRISAERMDATFTKEHPHAE